MTKKPVMMDARDFLKEHERLISVLKEGKRAKLNEEAMRQHKELEKAMARPNEHSENMSSRPEKMKKHAEGAPLRHMGY